MNQLTIPAGDGKPFQNKLHGAGRTVPERRKQQTHFILASKDKKAMVGGSPVLNAGYGERPSGPIGTGPTLYRS